MDFNLTNQSGYEFDIPNLSNKWKNPGTFTGYDEISDVKKFKDSLKDSGSMSRVDKVMLNCMGGCKSE